MRHFDWFSTTVICHLFVSGCGWCWRSGYYHGCLFLLHSSLCWRSSHGYFLGAILVIATCFCHGHWQSKHSDALINTKSYNSIIYTIDDVLWFARQSFRLVGWFHRYSHCWSCNHDSDRFGALWTFGCLVGQHFTHWIWHAKASIFLLRPKILEKFFKVCICTIGQKSEIIQKIHISIVSLFTKFILCKSNFWTKFTISKPHFHKIHNLKISFFSKFTFF